jgi:hypothetical protein
MTEEERIRLILEDPDASIVEIRLTGDAEIDPRLQPKPPEVANDRPL